MALKVKQLHRVNGGIAAPSTTSRVAGQVALNFPGAAGTADQPDLWAFDGTAWRKVNGGIAAHSTLRAYATNDLVTKDGYIYRAKESVSSGAWNPLQWECATGQEVSVPSNESAAGTPLQWARDGTDVYIYLDQWVLLTAATVFDNS